MNVSTLKKQSTFASEFNRLEYDNNEQKMDATNGISWLCCFGGIV